jgi:DNA-binding beta-propeller fold protein YncE
MAIDRDGRIAIADAANHQVLLTGPFLELETVVGEYGSFESQLQEPRGICFGVEGVLYVSDRGNRRVQAFDRTGFLLAATASVDDSDPPFVAPSGMATDRYGNVYVCDTGSSEIIVLTPDLVELARVGGPGLRDGNLERPVDCAIGPDGHLFVVDVGREALVVYEIIYP